MESENHYYIKKNILLRNNLDNLSCEILECMKEIDLFLDKSSKLLGKRKNDKTIDMNKVKKSK